MIQSSLPDLLVLALLLFPTSFGFSFENANNNNAFSLSAYQKARAEETSQYLDASRCHFQILFVDNNNSHGRLAEGVLARVAEYNDALCMLFPASATIDSSKNAPLDAAAPEAAIAICDSLGLCSTRSTAQGVSFSLDLLLEYDLIISMNEEVQNLILRSLSPNQQHSYGPKCRLLAEFLSVDFCGIHSKQSSNNDNLLLDMLDSDLYERAVPFSNLVRDSSSSNIFTSTITWKDAYEPRMALSGTGAAVPNTSGWPQIEAAILLASAGITRFCLDTMNSQMEAAFQSLLALHFSRKEHLEFTFHQADEQMRRGSVAISGYFSPQERQTRFEQHLASLRLKLLEP